MKNRPLCWAALLYVCVLFLTQVLSVRNNAFFDGACLGGIAEDARTGSFASGQTIKLSAVVYQYEKKETFTTVYLKDCVFSASVQSLKQRPCSKNVRCLAYIEKADGIQIGTKLTIQGQFQYLKEPVNEGQFHEAHYYNGQGIDFKLMSAIVLDREENRSWLQSLHDFRQILHNKIDQLSDQRTAGILQAMLLGEKGSVGAWEKDLFQDGSIGHILVISGLHFSIAGLGAFKLLKKIVGIKVAGIISVAFLFLFGAMTGFSCSAVRAFVMFAIYVLAQMTGRDYDLQTSLFIAVVVILWRNARTIFLPGFLLSVSAVLGIALFAPSMQYLCACKSKWLNNALGSFGIQLFSMPASLYFYFETNPYAMLINACVLPFLSFVILDAALALAVSFFGESVAWLMLRPAVWVIKGILLLCSGARRLPYSKLILGRPKPGQIVVYYALLFGITVLMKRVGKNGECPNQQENRKTNGVKRKRAAASKIGKTTRKGLLRETSQRKKSFGFRVEQARKTCLPDHLAIVARVKSPVAWLHSRLDACSAGGARFAVRGRRMKKAALLCLCFALPIILAFKNKPDFRLTMLDVGQGQCFYVEEKGGLKLLYDGGSADVKKVGQYRIAPFLKAIGCASLDLAVASHLDQDHCSGIVELIESGEIKIKMLALPDTMLQDDAFHELCQLAKKKGIDVRLFGRGDRWKCKDLTLLGLHPELSFITNSRNDASIVMRLTYQQFSALFCGDMEEKAEQKLLEEGTLLDCDVLQVAHHGSKYSTSEKFLQTVTPKFSFISSGEGNRYGHPHQELLQRLERNSEFVFLSQQNGAVTLEIRKGKLRILQMKKSIAVR